MLASDGSPGHRCLTSTRRPSTVRRTYVEAGVGEKSEVGLGESAYKGYICIKVRNGQRRATRLHRLSLAVSSLIGHVALRTFPKKQMLFLLLQRGAARPGEVMQIYPTLPNP